MNTFNIWTTLLQTNSLITGSLSTDAAPIDSTSPLADNSTPPLTESLTPPITTNSPVQMPSTDVPGLPTQLVPTTSNRVSRTTYYGTFTDSEQPETTVAM